MWAAVLLIGTSPLGMLASVQLSFLFIANIGIQALFVYLLGATQLTKPTYNREAVLQFRSWRRNEAHSIYNMDLQSLSSLGSRVCKGDVISQSGDISETYQEVDEYLGEDMPHGTLMLLLALIAWYCTISKEIHASMDAFHKVMALPRASSTTIVHHRSGQYEVVTLSCGRVVARCLVLLTRLVLSAFMTTQGTQFLVAEIGMGELLLNAVALEFVLLTDELLYAALAPLRVKRVIKNMSGFVGLKYATVYGIEPLTCAPSAPSASSAACWRGR